MSYTKPNSVMDGYDKQPFYVVGDDAYERMMTALKSGEPFVKSYYHVCPHDKKEDCDCYFTKNYLDGDGDMVKFINGTIKPVFSYSIFRELLKKQSPTSKIEILSIPFTPPK